MRGRERESEREVGEQIYEVWQYSGHKSGLGLAGEKRGEEVGKATRVVTLQSPHHVVTNSRHGSMVKVDD